MSTWYDVNMPPCKTYRWCFKRHPHWGCHRAATRLAVLKCSPPKQARTENLLQERGVAFTPGTCVRASHALLQARPLQGSTALTNSAATCLHHMNGTLSSAGNAFYRAESAQARDLVVLAASVYKQQHGQLRVLDVMSGSGMRGARYMQQVTVVLNRHEGCCDSLLCRIALCQMPSAFEMLHGEVEWTLATQLLLARTLYCQCARASL